MKLKETLQNLKLELSQLANTYYTKDSKVFNYYEKKYVGHYQDEEVTISHPVYTMPHKAFADFLTTLIEVVNNISSADTLTAFFNLAEKNLVNAKLKDIHLYLAEIKKIKANHEQNILTALN